MIDSVIRMRATGLGRGCDTTTLAPSPQRAGSNTLLRIPSLPDSLIWLKVPAGDVVIVGALPARRELWRSPPRGERIFLNEAYSVADEADDLMALLRVGGLRPLRLGGKTLLPIVQGGMGVGISAHRLAGRVAALGALGTISSVDLRRHHPDLMARTGHLDPGPAAAQAAKTAINEANLEALQREIVAARRPCRRSRDAGHQRHACGQRVRALGHPRPRMRHRRRGRRGRASAGPPGARARPSEGAAHPHPVGCTRSTAPPAQMGAQEANARCHRYRASGPRRRPPGRCESRRSAGSSLRLRRRHPAGLGIAARHRESTGKYP